MVYFKNNENNIVGGTSVSPFCISNSFWKDIVLSPKAHDSIFQVELPSVLTALNLVKSQRQSLSKSLSRNFHSCKLKGPTKEKLLSFESDGQYRIQTSKQEHCKGMYVQTTLYKLYSTATPLMEERYLQPISHLPSLFPLHGFLSASVP